MPDRKAVERADVRAVVARLLGEAVVSEPEEGCLRAEAERRRATAVRQQLGMARWLRAIDALDPAEDEPAGPAAAKA